MHPRTHRTSRVVATLLAAVVFVLGFGATPAAAHAALTDTAPGSDAVVKEAPEQVTLAFTEGVQLSDDSLKVLDPQGRDAAKGEAHHINGETKTAAVALQPGLPEGTFTVVWKAVSADSHPISGAFTFSIGAPSETTVEATDGDSGSNATLLYGVARYLAYAGFVLLVGGAIFAVASGGGSRVVQRVTTGGWAVLFIATVALLLLRGPYTGTGFGLTELREVVATEPGAALLSRLLLLGAAVVVLAVLFGSYERARANDDARERRDLALGLGLGGGVVAAGLAATWVMAEHASTGIQPWLAMPVAAAHLLAVAVWLGGLTALMLTLHTGPPVSRETVRNFSRLAFGSVLVLVATGLYQAWRGVGSWGALTGTQYGQLLLVKVGLIALLVGIASISRRWTARLGDPAEPEERKGKEGEERDEEDEDEGEPEKVSVAIAETASTGAGSDDPGPERAAQLARQRAATVAAREARARDADPVRSGLRRSVLTEAVIAVVVLGVATGLTGTQPGRAETTQAAAAADAGTPEAAEPVTVKIPFDTGGKNGAGTVEVTVDPGRTGKNALHTYLTNANGELMDVPEVKAELTLEKKGIGPLTADVEKVDTGHWSASDVQIPMAGAWTLSVTVRTSDIDQVTETKTVTID